MRIERFPVLADDDQDLLDRLAVGLGDREARVLAYLLLGGDRADFGEDPATLLSVRVGTGLGRAAAKRALRALVAADLVCETTADTGGQGRPPTAWTVEADRDTVCERVDTAHARALLDRAEAFAATRDDPAQDHEGVVASDRDRTVQVSLNWQPNGLHAPLFAARAAGTYADRDLTVTLEPRTGSGAALRDVASGQAPIGIVGSTTLLRGRSRDAPVVPLALLYQRALAVLYTTREAFGEPFERAEQLRGRRIGMPVGSEIGLLARLFLEQAGVAADVTVVNVEGEERTALLTGRVDVVTGSLSDPARIGAGGTTVDTIRIAERFPIYGPALVARRETLATHRSLLVDFLAGTVAGAGRARADPAAAAEAVAAVGDESATRARRTFEDAVETGWTSEAVAEHGWGWHRIEDWERLRDVLRQVGLLDDR